MPRCTRCFENALQTATARAVHNQVDEPSCAEAASPAPTPGTFAAVQFCAFASKPLQFGCDARTSMTQSESTRAVQRLCSFGPLRLSVEAVAVPSCSAFEARLMHSHKVAVQMQRTIAVARAQISGNRNP
jgi:hypothetical protein